MKTRSILIIGAAIGLFTLTPGLQVQAESRTSSALQELVKAKTSRHPGEQLEEAKVYLEISTQVLRSEERAEALHAIEAAIDDANRGDHHNMILHINFAIHEINDALH